MSWLTDAVRTDLGRRLLAELLRVAVAAISGLAAALAGQPLIG